MRRAVLAWLLFVVSFTSLADQSPDAEPLPLAVVGCASMGGQCVCRNEAGAVVPPVPSMCGAGVSINLSAFFPAAVAPVVSDDQPHFGSLAPPRARIGRFFLE